MTRDRMEWHLSNWADWRRFLDDETRGFPKRSLVFSCGGESAYDALEIVSDACNSQAAQTLDAMIDSLKSPLKTAINHVWLKVGHCYPTQDLDYEIAVDCLIGMAHKRAIA